MKKFLVFFILITAILFVGCDRFDHKFEIKPSNLGLDEFAQSFATSIASTTQYNYQELAALFSDNYYNNENNKEEMIEYFHNFFLVDPNAVFTADSIEVSPSLKITWHFQVFTEDKGVLEDVVIDDYLVEENDGYVFYGDHNNARKVIVELFTGQWCANCPNVEGALHELRMKYSSRFSYVEYHLNDQLASSSNMSLFSYYPQNGVLPLGMVNGNAHIVYSAPSLEEVKDEIDAAIEPLLQQSPQVMFSDVQTTLTDSLLNGTVMISANAAINLSDLKLVAVLMENYNTEYLNSHGEPHHNIALKRSVTDISGLDLSLPVEFSLENLHQLAPFYDQLPEDLTLVLWVQTLESSYNQDTCAVYNVIEIPL